MVQLMRIYINIGQWTCSVSKFHWLIGRLKKISYLSGSHCPFLSLFLLLAQVISLLLVLDLPISPLSRFSQQFLCVLRKIKNSRIRVLFQIMFIRGIIGQLDVQQDRHVILVHHPHLIGWALRNSIYSKIKTKPGEREQQCILYLFSCTWHRRLGPWQRWWSSRRHGRQAILVRIHILGPFGWGSCASLLQLLFSTWVSCHQNKLNNVICNIAEGYTAIWY